MLPRLAVTLALAILLPTAVAVAQTLPQAGVPPAEQVAQYDTPAYIAGVDGAATLERDGRVETSPLNMPLLSGDRLRTADGRVEVRFADGGRLFLDTRTTIDVMSDELVRLVDGRVRVLEMRTQDVNYRVDSVAGSARLIQAGDYRIALLHNPSASLGAGDRETQLELAIIRGAGEIFTENGTTPVRAGERAYASAGLAPSYAYAYNSANMDEFDRWPEMQRGTVYAAPASQSAQYLPADMSTYSSTFDQYGDWRYQQDYGYVWYPRVAADWRPYYYGRWTSYPTYGWTWIAADPFGYPTHHYGRWGISAGLWFWIPSHHWGPAYVSWGYATDYVSWCPLGWNNHAVFSINYYNVGPHYYSAGAHYYSAWTTVSRAHFGHGYAYQHAVNFDRGYSGARPHFTEGRTPGNDHPVARGAAPVRYAGTRTAGAAASLPAATGNSPRYINRGNEIVRSQTGRPIPPRDTAATRTETAVTRAAPPSSPGSTNRSYPAASSTPSYNPRSYSSPAAPVRRAETPYTARQTREPRAWDNPAYRPPAAPGSVEGRAYERAVPRAEPQSAPRPAPVREPQAPGGVAPRASERPAYQRPSQGGERAVPRSGGGSPQSAPSRSESRPAPAPAPRHGGGRSK